MLTVKYKTITGAEKRVHIPNSWRDFTWDQFVMLQRPYANRTEQLAAYTGVDINILLNNIEFLHYVNTVSGFIFNPMDIDYAGYMPKDVRKAIEDRALELSEGRTKEYDIQHDHWIRFEHTKIALCKAPQSPFAGTTEMLDVYFDMKVGAKACTEVFGVAALMLTQINAFCETFKALGETEVDIEEQAAGVNRFNKYGIYNVVRMFTGGDPSEEAIKKYEKTPLINIYTELLARKDERGFQKDLTQVKKLNADLKK